MRQTRIDIDNMLTVKTDTAALAFQYSDAPMTVLNKGHVVEVECPAGSTIHLGQFSSSGPVNWSQVSDEFQLLKFHFHAPSEHTIDGKQANMEMPLVEYLNGFQPAAGPFTANGSRQSVSRPRRFPALAARRSPSQRESRIACRSIPFRFAMSLSIPFSVPTRKAL